MQIRTHYFCVFLFTFLIFFTQKTVAQTSFEGGDIAIIGVNANNNSCAGTGGEDVITFVAFKDITNTTNFDITDNGWQRVTVGLWGDSEGIYRIERTGGTIPAGTTFELTLLTGFTGTQAANPGWTITNLNVPSTLDRVVNMNSGGDQMYVMQGGVWNNGGDTGEHDATYDGKILYGFNTRTTWNADGTSQQSDLHPEVDPCFFMNPTNGTTNYVHYTGPLTPATQFDWINRIKEPTNWTSYTNCNDYNTVPQLIPATLPILPSEMSVACSICTGGCGSYMETLTFTLPLTGGPFDVVYTDGTNNFTLTGINNGATTMVSVSASTTYSLVSVTANTNNNCPIYSNFAGEAMITFSGSGGGGMASFSGGGVLCSENCTTITLNVVGGTAPFSVGATVNYPPLINNFPFTVPATSNNFEIDVCADGLFPSYNIGTNTLTLPNFIVGNLSFSLASITDNTGCAGTVDPTPLILTIETSPTASPAALSACDQGGSIANFDLTTVNSTVNGGNGNTVTWFTDMAMLFPIGTPGSFPSGNTTVYAVSNTANCSSEPQPVTLTVNPSPTANTATLTACTSTGTAFFDLTSVDITVNGGTGNTVTWFSDISGNSPILNTTNFLSTTGFVYAVVTANGCSSQPTPVSLVVNFAPTGVPTTMTVCEIIGIPGFGDFDLTTLDNFVNAGSGLPVNWFNDAFGISQIPGGLITTTNTTVYAFIGTAPCTSNATPVTLTVTPVPSATTTIMDACAQVGTQAVFDLTSVDNTVNGGLGYNVTWYTDANAMNQILTPSSYLSGSNFVFAVVNAGTCNSSPTAIQLNVFPQPTANPTAATACDLGNGTAVFDLNLIANDVNSNPLNTVNWFSNISGTNPIFSPYTSAPTTIYAIVSNGTCSSAPTPVGLGIDTAPTATSTTASECDSGNGTANFDLTVLENTVNGGSGNTVTWYSDITMLNEIFSPYNTSTTIVFAVVSNGGNCDSPPTPINLNITAAPTANSASASACDQGNGTATFDLTLLENTVNGSSGNAVTWFSDINGNNPIPTSYSTGTTTVFAFVSNGGCTSAAAPVTLTLDPSPTANEFTTDGCSTNGISASFDLTTLSSMVNSNPTNTVSWYLYQNGTNPLPTPFTTSTTSVFAIVSNGTGCTSAPAEITLNVILAPTANTTSATECEIANGEASFNLDNLANAVNGGSGNSVSWFSDMNANNPIVSPYSTSSTIVYAVIDGINNCNSLPVAVDLTVTPTPSATATATSECDSGNGTADFDLSLLENTIEGGLGNTVNWYSDINTFNPIPSSPYNSATTVVYATVSDGTCTSQPVAIILNVLNPPAANIAAAAECDLGDGTADFILTGLENTVNGGSGNTVSWFSDMNANNPITSPYNSVTTVIYATVNDGVCNSQPVTINLTVESQPTANTAAASECDSGNGTATFDLSLLENTVNGGNGNTVNWFSDAGAMTSIPTNYNSGTTTIYATVTNGNCTSTSVAITLTVGNSPTANTAASTECDLGNGTADFDLSLLENTVNGGSGNVVSWFSDASAMTSIPTNYNSATTIVYAVVGNGNCISSPVPVNLNVDAMPTANTAMSDACDEGSNMATFDLSLLENTVNNGSGNVVSWYSDAGAMNSIPTAYATSTTIVYAVVENGNCPSAPVAVDLTVLSLPTASIASSSVCDNGNGTGTFDLTALENTVNGGTGFSVSWFSNANGMNSIPTSYTFAGGSVYAAVSDGTCVSQIVEITLDIDANLTAFPAATSLCDDGTGQANFDLSLLENTVNGGNGNTVNWFNDAAGMNPIPNAITTAATSVFAQVTDGTCVSQIVEVTLDIDANLTAFPAATSLCDDGTGQANFDLALLENTVNGGNGNTVNWFNDAAGMNPIPNAITTAATSVFAQVTDGTCVSQIVEVTLNIDANLTAFPAATSLCDDGTGQANFDLTLLENTVNGGNGNTVNWFNDAAGMNPIPNAITTAATSVFAQVTDGTCVSQIVEVTLDIDANLTAFPAATSLCDDGTGQANFDLALLENTVNGGNGNTVNWFNDAAGMNPIPNAITTAATSVFAQVTDGTCVSQIVEVTLDIDANLTAFPAATSLCDDGTGQANFDLALLENTVNGGNGNTVNWFNDAAGMNPIPNAITTAATSVFAQVTDGTCVSQIVEVTLNIDANLTAFPAATSLCADGTGQANFDLALLENTVNGGNGNTVNWFNDAAGMNPIPNAITTAATSVFAQVTDGNCVSQIVEVTLNIDANLTAFPAATSQCADGTGQANFDLALLENTVNGGNGNTVNWFNDAAGMNPIPNAITTAATSVFAQVTDGNCVSQIVEVTLNIDANLTAFPAATSQCADGTGQANFDLALLENTVNGGNGNTVNWFNDAAGMNPIPNTITTAATSVFAQVTDGNCVSQIVEVTLNIDANLTAFPAATSQCADGTGQANFDLSLLENTVNGGNGNTVNWFDDAAGMNPIPNAITTAATSVFAQVTDGNCVSQIVEVTLNIDANLTAFPAATSQCADGTGQANFDLALLENTVNGGNGNTVNWFNDAAGMNPIPNTITTAATSVFAQVTDGNCVSQIVEVTLDIDANLTAFPAATSLCDDGTGQANFDLSLLENTINGGNGNTVNWFDDAAGMNPIPNTITTAATSVFAQVTDGTCVSQIVEVTLDIDANLTAFPTATSLCDDGTGQANFDLALLENTVNGGNGNTVNWFNDAAGMNPIPNAITTAATSVFAQVTDGTCVSQIVEVDLSLNSNSTINIIETLCFGESMMVNNELYNAGNPSGIETLPNANGCDSTITVNLTFEPETTGSLTASSNLICSGNEVTLTFNLSGGNNFSIQYAEGLNPPILLSNINDGHTITVSPTTTTTYTLVEVTSLNTNCAPILPFTQATITVEEIQVSAMPTSAFGNFNVSCFNENDGSAMATPGNGTAPFNFQWSNGNNTPTIQNITAGNYEVTMTDANGCIATASTILTQPSEIQVATIPVSPPCADGGDGQVIINNIIGGVGPYSYSFDNGGSGTIQNFPTTIDFIQPGTYDIVVSDANGCSIDEQVTLLEPVGGQINLIETQTINLGESIELETMPNFIPVEIIWSNNTPCLDCITQSVSPTNPTTYVVTMIDANGCLATDEVTINVNKDQHLFIPNAFTPDDNGVNDIFYINAGNDVAEIKNFKIFTRWGETIFSQENFQPNDPTLGWDGFFKGKQLNPGVFVYLAEIVFKDGRVEIFKGDVTLH